MSISQRTWHENAPYRSRSPAWATAVRWNLPLPRK